MARGVGGAAARKTKGRIPPAQRFLLCAAGMSKRIRPALEVYRNVIKIAPPDDRLPPPVAAQLAKGRAQVAAAR